MNERVSAQARGGTLTAFAGFALLSGRSEGASGSQGLAERWGAEVGGGKGEESETKGETEGETEVEGGGCSARL
eukprot:1549555-Rhodomonas_salina.1